jgi:hypothetical protein
LNCAADLERRLLELDEEIDGSQTLNMGSREFLIKRFITQGRVFPCVPLDLNFSAIALSLFLDLIFDFSQSHFPNPLFFLSRHSTHSFVQQVFVQIFSAPQRSK